jgi:hypothetical protein
MKLKNSVSGRSVSNTPWTTCQLKVVPILAGQSSIAVCLRFGDPRRLPRIRSGVLRAGRVEAVYQIGRVFLAPHNLDDLTVGSSSASRPMRKMAYPVPTQTKSVDSPD